MLALGSSAAWRVFALWGLAGQPIALADSGPKSLAGNPQKLLAFFPFPFSSRHPLRFLSIVSRNPSGHLHPPKNHSTNITTTYVRPHHHHSHLSKLHHAPLPPVPFCLHFSPPPTPTTATRRTTSKQINNSSFRIASADRTQFRPSTCARFFTSRPASVYVSETPRWKLKTRVLTRATG